MQTVGQFHPRIILGHSCVTVAHANTEVGKEQWKMDVIPP